MKINITGVKRVVSYLILSTIYLAVAASGVFAGGDQLNYNFSGDGWAATGFGSLFNPANDLANDAVVQPDGKIVVVGGTTVGGNYDFAVVRFNPNGALDTTFGTGGKVSTRLASGLDIAEGAVVLSDGRIIVIGYYEHSPGNYQPAMARYLSNGSLQATFSWNYGPGSTIPSSVALAPDGKLVIAGSVINGATNSNWWVMRLTAGNFANDPTFGGGDGVVITDFNGGNDTAADVGVQANGYIVVAGTAQGASRNGQDFAIARYTTTGSLDPFFGTGGKTTTNFGAGSDDRGLGLLLTNGLTFVVAGDSSIFGGSIALAEYDYYGTLRTEFGGDGRVITNLNPDSTETATSIAWDSGGHYVVAGHVDSTVWPTCFTVVRYNLDGSLDDTFGTHGRVNTIFGTGNATAEAVVKTNLTVSEMAAIGSLHTATDYDMVVAAYVDRSMATRSDISADGRADFGVFRPSEGVWYFSDGASGAVSTVTLGASGDIPVPGDYDHDGITDASVYRPSDHTWSIHYSISGQVLVAPIGSGGEMPVQGDYDGDGYTDFATYTPSTYLWTLHRSTFGLKNVTLGQAGDKLVQGDYDGDGKTDVAVFRPSNGTWYIERSTFGSTSVQFGLNGDIPVPADYDGDGRTDIAVFRPSNASWYVITSQNGATVTTQWGLAGDIPAPADFDSDGKADLTVYRPGGGAWFVLRSSDGATGGLSFGLAGDVPVSSAYTLQ